MPGSVPLYYWDSCVFLSYFNGGSKRLPIIEALLRSASVDSSIKIVTSTLSITEVAYGQVEQTGKVNSAIEAAMDKFWSDRSVITFVDCHELIARQARALMRKGLQRGWKLKPPDAIHLATSALVGATEMHTYDEGLFKYHEDIGRIVREPFSPQMHLALPPET